MKPPFKFRPGLLVCSLALAPFAHAGAPRDSLGVSLVLVEHCQTRTDPDARPVDFGVSGFGGAHTTVPSGRAGEALAIRCSFGHYPSVTLLRGTHDGLAPGGRHALLSTGGNVLAYDLYADSGRSRPLGAHDAIALLPGAGEDGSRSLRLYAKAVDAPLPGAGTYTDTVVVQLTF